MAYGDELYAASEFVNKSMSRLVDRDFIHQADAQAVVDAYHQRCNEWTQCI